MEMEVTKCVNCGKVEVTGDHFEEDGHGDHENRRDLDFTWEFVRNLKDFGGDCDEEDGGVFKEGIGGELGKTCGECGDLIKKAVELRQGQRRLEEEVLNLQRELLGKLRCLEDDLGEYLEVMRRIEEKGVRRRRGNDVGVGFRRKVKRAVQDLSQWHGQLKRKTGGSNVTSEEPKLVLKTETFEEDEPVPSPVSPEANSVEEDDPLDSGGEPLEVDNPEPEQSSDSSSSDDSLPDLLSPFNLTIIRLCLRRKKMYLRKYRKHAKLPVPSPSSDNLPLDIRYQFNYSPSTSELTLNSHPIQIHHSPSTYLSCSLCPFTTTHNLPPTKSIDQIFNHYCHVHFSAFHCPHCPRTFKTRKKYQEHLATHQNPRKLIQCHICLKPFTRSDYLPQHLWLHKNAQEKATFIKNGGKAPLYYRNRTKELQNPGESLPCSQCGKLFSTQAYLKSHEKRHQREVSSDSSVICPLCGKTMSIESYRTYHAKYACPINNPKDKTRPSCSECGKSFQSKMSLLKHQKRMHSEQAKKREWTCELCQKGYKTQEDLRVHQKIHRKERPWKCGGCGREFNVKRNLARHKCPRK